MIFLSAAYIVNLFRGILTAKNRNIKTCDILQFVSPLLQKLVMLEN